MRSEEELTHLFTEYFSEKLSAAQIDQLVTDVTAGIQNRQARLAATRQAMALSGQATTHWTPEFAF